MNGDPRAVRVHFSALKMMALSPAHYAHAALKPWGGGTLAQRMGTAAHAATFEPHRLVEFRAGTFIDKKGKTREHSDMRRGEAWEAFKARPDHPRDAVFVNAKELAHARAIAAALHAHPIAAPLMFGADVIHEREILWSRDGRECSSRPDFRIPGAMIGDLKTCRSAQPERYTRDALWAYYHAQLRFYDFADAYETGRTPYDPRTRKGDRIDLYSVAIESAAPHVATVFALDDSAIISADLAIGTWWSRLMACEAENAWHGYRQSIELLTCDDPENNILAAFAVTDDAAENDNSGDDADDDWSKAS